MRRLAGARGQTSIEYLGVLLAASLIVTAVLLSGVGRTVADEISAVICRVSGGDCELSPTAVKPERCLESSTKKSSKASVLIAVVKVDKDSTLIRENYSDGSSKFTIIDNSAIAGELYAGVKGKIDKYGINYSASADAGLALAGARVFETKTPEEADAFQNAVQAAGGFDGILRDLASYDDKIPLLGVDNPFGGINDAALDLLGVDSDEDLPEPTETYIEAKALIGGKAGASAGLPGASAEVKALINAAGVAKVTTRGKDAGDVEISLQLDGKLNAALSEEMMGAGVGGEATGSFTATLKFDAQNGYAADSLELKGTAGYTGSLKLGPSFNAKDLKGLTDKLKTLSLTGSTGEGQGLEVGAKLDLKDPANRDAALALLTSGGDPGAVLALVDRFNQDAELSLDTFDQSSSSTESEVKVGVGPGLGAGGGSDTSATSGRNGVVRPPGGVFQPRVCLQPGG